MSILIIGATSGIGNFFYKYMISDFNISIFGVGTKLSNKDEFLFLCKLSNYNKLINIIKKKNINTIIHFASNLRPSSPIDNMKDEIVNIINPTKKIVQFCSNNNIKFVYVSTAGAIYDDDYPIFYENTPLNPKSAYGESKIILENFIIDEHKSNNLKFLILRPTNIINPSNLIEKNFGLFSHICNSFYKNSIFTLYGNPKKDFLDIRDFSIIVKSLLLNGTQNEIINIGSGNSYSLEEILIIFQNKFNKSINIIHKIPPVYEYNKLIVSINKLMVILNNNYKFYTINDTISNFILKFNHE